MLGPQSQANAAFAAFVVTWVAVVLLVLVVAHLHARLRRLEQDNRGSYTGGSGAALRASPYADLVGWSLTDLVGESPVSRVLLVLSANCTSCQRLLADLADPSWSIPTVLAWSDGADGIPGDHLPVRTLPDGPRVAAALGVRITPFGLVCDEDGRVVWAGPVTGLKTLADRVRSAPARIPATGMRQP